MRRQTRDRRPSHPEKRGTGKQKQNRKKEQAVTYLSESDRMNMEEPNDSKVQSSKCFTNYQAVANRINMILFRGVRLLNIISLLFNGLVCKIYKATFT